MSRNLFETANRKLEQFLFMHDIHHTGFYKNMDGMTVWMYSLDEDGRRVLEEWRQIVARRNQRKENKGK